ncbi:unnamed protein product, partial [Heterotrigona itama]
VMTFVTRNVENKAKYDTKKRLFNDILDKWRSNFGHIACHTKFKKKVTNYCIRFGHSLWSANQLPAQGVDSFENFLSQKSYI